jgi:SAM-dependent methyltransferase
MMPNALQAIYFEKYPALVARLRENNGDSAAFEQAVGGDFITVGYLEACLLRSLGLGPKDLVIDVGCGSGRLTTQLATLRELRYVGTDIVGDLLEQARKLACRPDWRFELTDGLAIPCEDDSADFVCFFSVLTHLSHEDAYRYLREATRVVRPGGRIVFSFLEFAIFSHWDIFEASVDRGSVGDHHNRFIEKTAIDAWRHRLGLNLDAIFDGDKPHIPIDRELVWHDGRVIRDLGALGQSVAVVSKPK